MNICLENNIIWAELLTILRHGQGYTVSEISKCLGVSRTILEREVAQLIEKKIIQTRKYGAHNYLVLSPNRNLNYPFLNTQKKIVTGPKDPEMRKARTCYGHLAGDLGVHMYRQLVKKKILVENLDGCCKVSDKGIGYFNSYGIQAQDLKCKQCIDWSLRTPHIGGKLGSAILRTLIRNNVLKVSPNNRRLVEVPNNTTTKFESYLRIS